MLPTTYHYRDMNYDGFYTGKKCKNLIFSWRPNSRIFQAYHYFAWSTFPSSLFSQLLQEKEKQFKALRFIDRDFLECLHNGFPLPCLAKDSECSV